MNIVLYNPFANNGESTKALNKYKKICDKYEDGIIVYDLSMVDLKTINYDDNDLIIIGGDETIHPLWNSLKKLRLYNEIFVFRAGSNSDLANEFEDELINITKLYRNMCSALTDTENVNFINGCGFGFDSLTLTSMKESKDGTFKSHLAKSIDEMKLFDVKVIVDEEEYNFTNVALANIMSGKYVNGMKLSPISNRFDEYVEVVIVHSFQKTKLAKYVNKITKGKHIKDGNVVFIKSGRYVRITASESLPVHLDGILYDDSKQISVRLD